MSSVFNFTFVPWFRSVAPDIHKFRNQTFVVGIAGTNRGQIQITTIQNGDLNGEAPLPDSDVRKPGLHDQISLQPNRYVRKKLLNT